MTEQKPACTICRAEILPGAKYCPTCQNYQNPLSRILYSINIQALVALVPVITLAVVFLKDQVTVDRSNMLITATQCSRSDIVLAALNNGNQTALFKGAEVGIALGPAAPTKWFSLRLESEKDGAGKAIYEPGKPQFIRLSVRGRNDAPIRLPLTADDGKCQYRVSATFFALDLQPQKRLASCSCVPN